MSADTLTKDQHDELTVATESDYGHRIVCAAVKLADGRVICGVRHFDLLMRAMLPAAIDEAHKVLAGHEQGFVDNTYRFRDRNAAWTIALAAKQFDPGSPKFRGLCGCLFSEDVW